MDNNFIELYNSFCKIKNTGWICSMRDCNTGVGYTFERMLKKDEVNL